MELARVFIRSFVAFILAITSFVVDLIGLGAPYWYYIDTGSQLTMEDCGYFVHLHRHQHRV